MSQVAQHQSTEMSVFETDTLDKLMRFGDFMANAKSTLPRHLQGNAADCTAVAMQAYRWKMDPFAVAQKTHLVNGVLGYEAQLVVAVINSRAPIRERLNYAWEGNWTGVNGKTDKEESRACTVSATIVGEAEPRVLRVSMAQVGVRNSPLWVDDPRQQLAYLTAKRWSRLHTPDVIMGVYTPDELQEFIPAQEPVSRDTQSAFRRDEPVEDAQIVDEKPAEPTPETAEEFTKRFEAMQHLIATAPDVEFLVAMQHRIAKEFKTEKTAQEYNDLVAMWKNKRARLLQQQDAAAAKQQEQEQDPPAE